MKEKKHLLKLLFGTTLCIVMLLGIALSVPGYTAHAEEEKEELFYTFSEELDKTETSAVPFSLFGAMDGSVELSGTNEEKWINRLDLTGEAGITLEMYNSLVEASDNDGSLDYLIEDQYYTDGEASFTMITVTGDFSLEGENSDYETMLSNIANEVAADYTPFIRAAFDAFDRDHPEVFWLDGATAYTTTASATVNQAGGYDYVIKIDLLLKGTTSSGAFDIRANGYRSEATIKRVITSMQADRTAILDGITADMGTVDKIKFFNEKLTKTNGYNTSPNLSSENIGHNARECVSALDGGFGTGGPVCEGYARAFKVLCDAAGIPCVLVDGYAKNSANENGEAHMWNYVQVDGSWYAVDVTWNDPKVEGVLEAESGAESGAESEDYLLVGSSTIPKGETLTFLESHPVANQASQGGVGFTNGPVLMVHAYGQHTYTNGTCACGDEGYTYDATANSYAVYKAGAMQAAIDAAEVSGTTQKPATIKLMADLDLPGVEPDPYMPEVKYYGVLIDAGVMSIDLNGFTLSNSDAIATIQIGTGSNVSCGAVVTIMDSSAQGNGAVTEVGTVAHGKYSIINYCGTLFVNSGMIKAEGTDRAISIDNYNGTVTVTGGKIYASTTSENLGAFGINSQGTNNPSLTVNGGEISGNGTKGYGISIGGGTFTIKDGTIAGGRYALSISSGVEASITGGSFTGSILTYTDGLRFLGIDENGKGATFPNGIKVENNTLNAILATDAGFYDASGNLLTVANDATSITGTVTVGCANHTGGTATCAKKAVCTTCGREYGEVDADNHGAMDPATGECSNSCGNFLAVASVTTGEGTTYYAELQTAIDAAELSNGCTLTLETNITSENGFTIDAGSFTLELNGKTLDVTGTSHALQVNGCNHLVIQDSST